MKNKISGQNVDWRGVAATKIGCPIGRGATFALLCLISILSAKASDVKMAIPSGDYMHKLPEGSLNDPAGKSHTKQSVIGKVIVAIFSAPNMSQGDVQQKWATLLADNPKTKVPDEVGLYLVEDMTQAGIFRGAAQDSMKKEFTPQSRPVLLLDQTGQLFKDFGVKRGSTQILIYDKTGTLRDVETKLDDADANVTAKRVRVISKKLMAE